MFNIGVLIYTYNRTDDAKINMEIIRNYWQKNNLFNQIKIVHSFNGRKQWYPDKYLEDDLVFNENSTHYQGASDLIDAGMSVFKDKYSDLDYIIVLAADTWIVKPEFIERTLSSMKSDNQNLATCSWGLPEKNDMTEVGMAVDFFIIDLKWSSCYQMFPINFKNFADKYSEILLYQGRQVLLEKLVLTRFMQAVSRELNVNVGLKQAIISKIFRINDREPIHQRIDSDGFWQREMYWEKIGLITHHDAEPKRDILRNFQINEGENINKLLTSSDLDYYNKI